jgi:23S rRNA (uracil1939-C5)-methyltransferase
VKKGKTVEQLKITGISSDGKAVGRKNGLVIFVKGAAPGDTVDVQITGRDKKFLLGKIVRFHEESTDRVTPFCDHFGVCGGCKWQHITYESQLRHKQQHVEDNMKKISGMSLPDLEPIIGSSDTTFYRNKLEFTFSNNRWLTREEIASGKEFSRNALGFHIPKMFDKILDIQECHLQGTPSNLIRNAVREYAEKHQLSFYDIKKHEGLLRNLIIRTSTTKELMVIVQFGKREREQIVGLMNFLHEEFPEITSLNYVVNEKKNETFYDLPVTNFYGEEFIHERMGYLTFRIGPKSFYQTNSRQAEVLYQKVLEYADLSGEEIVYDLYTGTGTIANFVAHKARKVVGIESVADAVEDAKKNSGINGILNTEFYAGDMKDMLGNDFIKNHGKPKVIITDPPRAGMHKNVVKALNRIQADRIVYVSCNPSTQARDLQELEENYFVKRIQPVDMFPHTHHVENIALLIHKKYA